MPKCGNRLRPAKLKTGDCSLFLLAVSHSCSYRKFLTVATQEFVWPCGILYWKNCFFFFFFFPYELFFSWISSLIWFTMWLYKYLWWHSTTDDLGWEMMWEWEKAGTASLEILHTWENTKLHLKEERIRSGMTHRRRELKDIHDSPERKMWLKMPNGATTGGEDDFQIIQSAGSSVFHPFWNFTWRELGSRRWSWWAKTAAKVVGLHGHDPYTSNELQDLKWDPMGEYDPQIY